MRNASTTKKTAKSGWEKFDRMTAAQRSAAARADKDARPLTPTALKKLRRTPQIKIVRRALGLSQEEFALRFHIPIGTLRDWEQARKDPDAAARAYLRVIARDPEAVADALNARGAAR